MTIVALPLKRESAIAIGEIIGDYEYKIERNDAENRVKNLIISYYSKDNKTTFSHTNSSLCLPIVTIYFKFEHTLSSIL